MTAQWSEAVTWEEKGGGQRGREGESEGGGGSETENSSDQTRLSNCVRPRERGEEAGSGEPICREPISGEKQL